jgi:CDP-diacylglycerol---glycerol-3-phosphate 3-phosphatidyltransferase
MSYNDNIIWNVPNILTMVRLVLSLVVFALLPWQRWECTSAALVLFIIAAGTDWVDGYWARRYNQITKLGRILDPFVDKILICGTFVILAAEQLAAGQAFGITGWMAVVIMGREMLVTALRSFIEQGGGDFSAKWLAKWKMGFQCIAAGAAMVCLIYHQQGLTSTPHWLWWTLVVSLWLTLWTTIHSGIDYIVAAMRILSAKEAAK